MMLICFMVLVIGPTIHCLTCKEVVDRPYDRNITFQEIKSMKTKDLVNCLTDLTRQPLRMDVAEYIWQTLVDYYEGVPYIPQNVLSKLHWVTPAIRPEEYANMSLDTIEGVKNFGLSYGLDIAQLMAIADRVRADFSGKRPEDYTYYDLRALNHILCAFNQSEIERIHPSAYREAAVFIGKLKECNHETMTGFATLAVHKDAFGPSKDWSGLVVKIVGRVAEFLPGGISKELEDRKKTDTEIMDEFVDPGTDFLNVF